MDFELIQSASIAAVRTALQDQQFNVKWKNSSDGGKWKAPSMARLEIISIQQQNPFVVQEMSGSVIVEYEVVDQVVTIQHQFETTSQTLISSSWHYANQVQSALELTEIQQLYKSASIAPIHPIGNINISDRQNDKGRWLSLATFDVRFNTRTLKRLPDYDFGQICAVYYTGSISSKQAEGLVYDDCYIIPGGMDEGIVQFDNEVSKSFNFGIAFDFVPDALVLRQTDDSVVSSSTNVEWCVRSYNAVSATIDLTAPWSGSLRYRCLSIPTSPKWPAWVTSSLYPESGTLQASGRKMHSNYLTGIDKTAWQTYYQSLTPSGTMDFWMTYHANSKDTGIPAIIVDTFTSSSATGSVSCHPFGPNGSSGGSFHHVVFRSGAMI
jgi:hypothetical protein